MGTISNNDVSSFACFQGINGSIIFIFIFLHFVFVRHSIPLRSLRPWLKTTHYSHYLYYHAPSYLPLIYVIPFQSLHLWNVDTFFKHEYNVHKDLDLPYLITELTPWEENFKNIYHQSLLLFGCP